jgi:DNA-binding NarL/FixJ family response regulator
MEKANNNRREFYNHTTMDKTVHNLSNKRSCRPLRIFLVEDSAIVRELITDSLAEVPGIIFAGFSDTERDAFEKMSVQSFDILILDIELKQGNGMSLLRTLAKFHIQPENLKIIFSNNVSDAYRRAGEQYGVRYFFDKSFEFPELCSLLERLGAGTYAE